MTCLFRSLLLLFIVLLAVPSSWSMFQDLSSPVPIARLIKNVSEYVQNNPDDAHGYYTLGRLHSYAFAKGNTEELIEQTFILHEDQQRTKLLPLPQFAPMESIYLKPDTARISNKQKNHLLDSIHYYYIATRKDPDNGLYFLGLAWMLEQGIPYLIELGWPPVYIQFENAHKKNHNDEFHRRILEATAYRGGKETWQYQSMLQMIERSALCIQYIWLETDSRNRKYFEEFLDLWWKERTITFYRRAYSLHIYKEVKDKSFFLIPQSQIGVEAGHAIIRLLKNNPKSPEQSWEIESIEKAINIATSGGGGISPVIFSLTPNNSLHSLLDPQTTASFDLDGFGAANYPWVKPETAILVWDPERSGKMTSGKQLFGSVTWWMFWRDGYEALASLDDDNSDWLEGAELDGIAVWQDRNSNGISDAGEVTPIEQTEIEKLCVRPSTRQGRTIECRKGLILRNGEVLPTYDWVVEKK